MLAPARYGCAAWSIRQAWNRERSSSVPRSRYQGAWCTSPLAVYTAIAGITTGWWWPWARTAQGHCSPTRSQPRAWGASGLHLGRWWTVRVASTSPWATVRQHRAIGIAATQYYGCHPPCSLRMGSLPSSGSRTMLRIPTWVRWVRCSYRRGWSMPMASPDSATCSARTPWVVLAVKPW